MSDGHAFEYLTRDMRLERALRTNARVRAMTQLLILAVWVIWVRSPWMAVFFGVRWVPIVLVLVAARLLPRLGRVAAVSIAAAGQAFAALSTVALLPEFVGIVVLIMFGDLQLAKFLDRRHANRYLAGFVVVAGLVGLLSIQSWTGLGGSVPRSVLVAVVVIHTAATGLVSSRFARESYAAMRRSMEELRLLGSRLVRAVDTERERVSTELERGALNDLSGLADRLVAIDQQLNDDPDAAVLAAQEAAAEAQRALGALRALSHGVFPDVLRQFGLGQALRGLAGSAASVSVASVPEERIDPSAELALYRCAVEVVRHVEVSGGAVAITATLRSGVAELEASCEGEPASGDAFRQSSEFAALVDRLRAVGGEAAVAPRAIGFVVRAQVAAEPADEAPETAEAAVTTEDLASSGRLLLRFNIVGSLLAAFGTVVAGAVAAATTNASAFVVAGVLAVVLVVSLVSLRSTRHGFRAWSVYTLAVCTSTAALVMTAAVPSFVPMNAVLAIVPMSLVLPHLASRALNLIAMLQTATLAGVSLLALSDTALLSFTDLPRPVVLVFVPLSTAVVAALVAYTELMTYTEVAERASAVRAALRRLMNASDHERDRVERDLHDGAQQHFVALSMQCRVLGRLATSDAERAHRLVATLLDEIGDARREVLDLVAGRFPDAVEQGRPTDALRQMAAAAPLSVEVRSTLIEPVSLSAASVVYFACREAVQNAAKHAGPDARVVIRLGNAGAELGGDAESVSEGEAVTFEVSDDGVGFDPASVLSSRGFRSLRDRVEMAGGSLTIRSAEGEGTTLSGSVPR